MASTYHRIKISKQSYGNKKLTNTTKPVIDDNNTLSISIMTNLEIDELEKSLNR